MELRHGMEVCKINGMKRFTVNLPECMSVPDPDLLSDEVEVTDGRTSYIYNKQYFLSLLKFGNRWVVCD